MPTKPNLETAAKPPGGPPPRWLWLERRIVELEAAMERYADNKHDIPHEWFTEYLEHRKSLWRLTGKES